MQNKWFEAKMVADLKVKEKPLMFSTMMVKATLSGVKTHTRRIAGLEKANVNPEAWDNPYYDSGVWVFESKYSPLDVAFCKPRFQVGDRFWIKETYYIKSRFFTDEPKFIYKADAPNALIETLNGHWKSSMFMKKIYARDVRGEIVYSTPKRLLDMRLAHLIIDILAISFVMFIMGLFGFWLGIEVIMGIFLGFTIIGFARRSRNVTPFVDRKKVEVDFTAPPKITFTEPKRPAKIEPAPKKEPVKTEAKPKSDIPNFEETDFQAWSKWINDHPDMIRARKS